MYPRGNTEKSTQARSGWRRRVLDSYLLMLSALLLSGGAAGDRYGRRRVVLTGLAVFTVASLACGLAPTNAMPTQSSAIGVTQASAPVVQCTSISSDHGAIRTCRRMPHRRRPGL
jgi:nitrate/nitrite transporter NarK